MVSSNCRQVRHKNQIRFDHFQITFNWSMLIARFEKEYSHQLNQNFARDTERQKENESDEVYIRLLAY